MINNNYGYSILVVFIAISFLLQNKESSPISGIRTDMYIKK